MLAPQSAASKRTVQKWRPATPSALNRSTWGAVIRLNHADAATDAAPSSRVCPKGCRLTPARVANLKAGWSERGHRRRVAAGDQLGDTFDMQHSLSQCINLPVLTLCRKSIPRMTRDLFPPRAFRRPRASFHNNCAAGSRPDVALAGVSRHIPVPTAQGDSACTMPNTARSQSAWRTGSCIFGFRVDPKGAGHRDRGHVLNEPCTLSKTISSLRT